MTPKPESETDPVRELCKLLDEAGATVQFGLRAQGHIPTIERMLADGRSWKSIGKEIGWEPLTAAEWYVRELTKARAAEAAQHRQEIAAKDAHLGRMLSNHYDADVVELRAEMAAKDETIRQQAEQIAALTAERDRLKAALEGVDGRIGKVAQMLPGMDIPGPERHSLIVTLKGWRQTLRAALTPQGQSTDGETR